MLTDNCSLAEVVTVLSIFISLAAICVNLVVLGTMSVLVQSSHWRSRHPAMLWVSVCLADTVTAIVLVISRLSDRPPGPESWLTLVIRVSSYSSIISVSSLSLDKMLSIARPFTYTLHRGHLMAPILVLVWVLSVCVAALDTVLGLAFVFLPCCLVLVPCQLYLYVVASRHYRNILQVKRCIAAKEVSDNAFLSCNISCTPTSVMKMDKTSSSGPPISSHRMRNYRWILFTTCSVFLLTWLPHMVSGLIPAETDVAGLSDLSLVSLSSGLLTTPIIHPGQNKELQQVLKKLLIRKPKTEENFKLGIIRTEDPERKEEVVEDSNEWWVIIRLQVDKLGKYCSKVVQREVEQETKHSANIFDCGEPECAGTGV